MYTSNKGAIYMLIRSESFSIRFAKVNRCIYMTHIYYIYIHIYIYYYETRGMKYYIYFHYICEMFAINIYIFLYIYIYHISVHIYNFFLTWQIIIGTTKVRLILA